MANWTSTSYYIEVSKDDLNNVLKFISVRA